MLTPSHTLAEFLPPDGALSLRAPLDGLDWLPDDPVWVERVTGGPLAVAGDAPVLCHEGVARPEALELLAKMGLPVPGRLVTYADEASYRTGLRELAAEGRRLTISHPEPHPILPPDRYVVPMPVLRRLHDKGRLAEVVPREALPERRTVSSAEFARRVEAGSLDTPIVVKVASSLGSGAGIDVRICRAPRDLRRAQRELGGAERLVLERLYRFRRTFCLNYGIGPESVAYLGAGEQVCDASGGYGGNWLESDVQPEAELVEHGRGVAEAGRVAGYRGILGVDGGICETGRAILFDANFRMNGCTSQVLLATSIAAAWSRPCTRIRPGVTFAGDFAGMIEVLHRRVEARSVVPLILLDGSALAIPAPHPTCNLLIAGDSREDVERRIGELRGDGFVL